MVTVKLCDYYPDIIPLKLPTELEGKEHEAEREQFLRDHVFPLRRLYQALRQVLIESFAFTGVLPHKVEDLRGADLKEADKAYYLSVHGLLIADGVRLEGEVTGPDDLVIEAKEDIDPAKGRQSQFRVSQRFVRSVTAAVQEYQANKALFNRVYLELARIGTEEVGGETIRTVFGRQLGEVTRRLAEQRVNPGDPQIRHRIEDALSLALGDKIDGRASAIVLDLPDLDLDAGTTADIIKDNLLAMAVIYYSAMVEEWKFFAVADKVAEQFTNGMLPITKGRGGDLVYEYIRNATQRMTEFERRGLYARGLGLAQGSIDEQMPNRSFPDLWIRFLSAASLLNRQAKEERKLVSEEQLFKSARDLAVNLSLHGYGMAHFAAAELQKLIKDVHSMLSSPELLSSYGVRDPNQLVDRVSILYLNGAVNGVRQRTMAHSGSKVIRWLADQAQTLSSPGSRAGLFDRNSARFQELVGNVERWLAVTGTPDTTVEQFSEPIAVAAQPTIPTLGFDGLTGGFKSMLDRAGALPQPALPAVT